MLMMRISLGICGAVDLKQIQHFLFNSLLWQYSVDPLYDFFFLQMLFNDTIFYEDSKKNHLDHAISRPKLNYSKKSYNNFFYLVFSLFEKKKFNNLKFL